MSRESKVVRDVENGAERRISGDPLCNAALQLGCKLKILRTSNSKTPSASRPKANGAKLIRFLLPKGLTPQQMADAIKKLQQQHAKKK
jgi:hypothetical protein